MRDASFRDYQWAHLDDAGTVVAKQQFAGDDSSR